ncbi:MAG: hypothetical protein M5R41_09365 [Bacteroidia bacterium]|nr:hypothetical protein [Bacteroidia bacterium]
MNERIHELIIGYLHGGNTPEQDKELFDACSMHPETAEHLRMQIMLSLKLRGLREQTQVPADLRNDLLLRVNELQAGREAAMPPAPVASLAPRRFGWAHMFGSALAAGAAVWMLFFFVTESDIPVSNAGIIDTLRVVERDTVVQTRDIVRPVYITRTAEQARPDDAAAEDMPALTDRPVAPDAVTPDIPSVLEDVSYAEVQPLRELQRQAKVSQYLQQYNAMLASVESVQLTSRDRVSQ